MVNKQDDIWNYKTMTLPYDISQKKQIQKQTYCPEERKWTRKKTTKTSRCSKKSYGYNEQQVKIEHLLYYSEKNIYK